jgi:hypothetical protein
MKIESICTNTTRTILHIYRGARSQVPCSTMTLHSMNPLHSHLVQASIYLSFRLGFCDSNSCLVMLGFDLTLRSEHSLSYGFGFGNF